MSKKKSSSKSAAAPAVAKTVIPVNAPASLVAPGITSIEIVRSASADQSAGKIEARYLAGTEIVAAFLAVSDGFTPQAQVSLPPGQWLESTNGVPGAIHTGPSALGYAFIKTQFNAINTSLVRVA